MKKVLLAFTLLASIVTQAQIWSENFNGGTMLPMGWSQTTWSSNGGWLIGTPAALSSASYAIPAADGNVICTNDDVIQVNDKSNDFLMLPSFDLTGVSAPYLMFDMYYNKLSYNGITEYCTFEASIDGGTNWTVLFEIEAGSGWTAQAYDLSAYANMNDVRVGFRYNDGGGWLYGFAIDNMQLIEPDLSIIDASIQGTALGVEVAAVPSVELGFTKYIAGETVVPIAMITNNAFSNITSYNVSYTQNGGAMVTESVTGVSLGLGEMDLHYFTTLATVASGNNTFTYTISNVNGGAETVTDNNAGEDNTLIGVVPNPNRVVVGEEGTGTWCQWCPRGTVFMEYLAGKYPTNFIGIAVHNGDPMTVATYDSGLGANISGYPSGLVDRADFEGFGEVDPSSFERALMERIDTDNGVMVNTTVDIDGLQATVTSNLEFTADMSGTYKVAVVIIEDEVSGTGATWNQVNTYSGGAFGPMGGFESLANPVPASTIDYDHVARALVGGWAGATGSVPADPTNGLVHSYNSIVTLDAGWDLVNCRAVTLLIKSSTGEIVNAGVSQTLAVNVEEFTSSTNAISVFPNPASDLTYVRLNVESKTDVTLRITDNTGKLIFEQAYKSLNKDGVIPVDTSNFASGIYSVSVSDSKAIVTKTLVIN